MFRSTTNIWNLNISLNDILAPPSFNFYLFRALLVNNFCGIVIFYFGIQQSPWWFNDYLRRQMLQITFLTFHLCPLDRSITSLIKTPLWLFHRFTTVSWLKSIIKIIKFIKKFTEQYIYVGEEGFHIAYDQIAKSYWRWWNKSREYPTRGH